MMNMKLLAVVTPPYIYHKPQKYENKCSALTFVYVDYEDAKFARIVGGVCDTIKLQPLIVAVLLVLRTTNTLRITKNIQREGPEVRCSLIKIIAYML